MEFYYMKRKIISIVVIILSILAAIAITFFSSSSKTDLGSVNTSFKLFGSDHLVSVAQFYDEEIPGISCYISRAKTGGIKGSLGIAEDSSDAAISCQQVKNIDISKISVDQTQVFNERRSIGFKKLRVVRMFDKDNNTLIYLVYSDKLVDGSPQNSLSAVHINNNK